MLSVRISSELEQRITALAKMTGRSKSYYVNEMLENQIDSIEQRYQSHAISPNQQARDELEKSDLPTMTKTQFYQELDEIFND